MQMKYRGCGPYIFFFFELENSGRVSLGKKIERGSILPPARAALGARVWAGTIWKRDRPGRQKKYSKRIRIKEGLYAHTVEYV